MDNLNASNSPVIAKPSTRRVMIDLLIALAPATIAAIVFFGLNAAVIIAVCVGTSLLSEFLFDLLAKKEQTVGDLSAVVTGLLLALTLPTYATLWQCLVGSVFAIVIVKCAFGGLGRNITNPAITARVMLILAFSKLWEEPIKQEILASGATPMSILGGEAGELPSILDMLSGNRGGAVGETCIIALVIGGIYLIIRKAITWEIPVFYIGGTFLLSFALCGDVMNALYYTLSGSLILGAIFMATDPVTSPKKWYGKMIFGFLCALITVLIRFYGNYSEGVYFAILLMNILCPYIDMSGAKKEKGENA